MATDEELLPAIASIMRNAGRGAHRDIMGNLLVGDIPLCRMCLGPLKTAAFEECYTCGREGPSPRPQTYFLSYSGATPQSVIDMARYKADDPSGPALSRLKILLYLGLKNHHKCIAEDVGGTDVVTYVPSGKGPVSALRLVIPEMQLPVAEMQYLPPYREGRAEGFETSKFSAQRDLFSDKRVILIEDSWFKGFNARSAAAALYGAGARSVKILVLARRLGSGYGVQDQLLSKISDEQEYDHRFCPAGLDFHD